MIDIRRSSSSRFTEKGRARACRQIQSVNCCLLWVRLGAPCISGISFDGVGGNPYAIDTFLRLHVIMFHRKTKHAFLLSSRRSIPATRSGLFRVYFVCREFERYRNNARLQLPIDLEGTRTRGLSIKIRRRGEVVPVVRQ